MNYKNIKFFNIDFEKRIFDLAISSFFTLYILKQSQVFNLLPKILFDFIFQYLLIIGVLVIFFLRRNEFKNFFLRLKFKNLLMLFSSSLLAQVVFFEMNKILINFSKLSIIILIVIAISKSFKKYIQIISDSILLGVFFNFFISNIFLPTSIFETDLWTKTSIGFINPNLPALFIFASILGYFIVDCRKKMIVTSSIYFLMYFFVQSHSRTASLSIILLLSSYLINTKFFEKFLKYLSLILNSIYFLIFFSLSSSSIFLERHLEIIHRLDNLSSSRLFKISNLNWNLNSEGEILKLSPIDSIIFESFVYIGIISIFFFVILYLERLKFRFNLFKPKIAIYTIMLTGIFEGIFFKITPIILFLAIIIFDNFLVRDNSVNGKL